MSADFALVRIGRIFHATNHVSLERLTFLDQFLDAFRISILCTGQSLQIARLSGGVLAEAPPPGRRYDLKEPGAKR
ncbi:MAG: hypothetical protein ABSE45_06195 [Candidatus Acidiferrales bacterium]